MSISIAIADDHPLVVSGLRHILDAIPDLRITGAYSDGDELLEGLKKNQPEVLLLDIQMPGITGDELAPILAANYPTMKIVALTNHDDLYYIEKMLDHDVRAYLMKTTSEDILISAIRAVHRGETYIEKPILEKLARHRETEQKNKDAIPALTRREQEILRYIAADLTSQEIADKLFVSKKTVDYHRHSLLLKLNARNAASLIKRALQLGLVK